MIQPTLRNQTVVVNKFLRKLTVFTTDACNLHCRYCYVRRSSHQPGRTMDANEGARFVRNILSNYRRCGMIQFFGGEPLLNIDCIEAIVDEIERMVCESLLVERPQFAVVTNGVFVDFPKAVSLIRKHGFLVTVSLDGPADVHDALRPKASGGGSYSDTTAAIFRLQDLGIPVQIESVYTTLHIDRGISMRDLIVFLSDLRIPRLALDPAYPPAPRHLIPLHEPYTRPLIQSYTSAVDFVMQELIEHNRLVVRGIVDDYLRAMLDGVPASRSGKCPAGEEQLAVDPSGRLYPCLLFYGYRQFCFGSATSSLEALANKDSVQRLYPRKAEEFAECRSCRIRYWCRPCAAMNIRWGDVSTPMKQECEWKHALVHRIAHWAFGYAQLPENHYTSILREFYEHAVVAS